jgi:hypothetical protein
VAPVAVLERRMVKRNNEPVPKIWLQWSNLTPEEASYMGRKISTLLSKKQFPYFLEG